MCVIFQFSQLARFPAIYRYKVSVVRLSRYTGDFLQIICGFCFEMSKYDFKVGRKLYFHFWLFLIFSCKIVSRMLKNFRNEICDLETRYSDNSDLLRWENSGSFLDGSLKSLYVFRKYSRIRCFQLNIHKWKSFKSIKACLNKRITYIQNRT